jgi:hypothetical protein
MGSYEQWDALIRQCVVWLQVEGLAAFGLEDPAECVARNYDDDPEPVPVNHRHPPTGPTHTLPSPRLPHRGNNLLRIRR